MVNIFNTIYMCDTSSERKFFSVHNDVMREYIHMFVKSQDGFLWPIVQDSGIRNSIIFLSFYKILNFFYDIYFYLYYKFYLIFK